MRIIEVLMNTKKSTSFSPGRVILYTLCAAIGLGTCLLALPFARTTPIPLLDLIFTATSALCVTGLFTVSLNQFTLFGHAVLLLLMQIGGLGLITITFLIMYLIIDVGFATKVKVGKLLEVESWQSLHKIMKTALYVTVSAEIIGTLCLFPFFYSHMPAARALFYALFHAVSCFCNAGILCLPTTVLQTLQTSYTMLIITSSLMFAGGIGFLTWNEVVYAASRYIHGKRHHFSLQTKIVGYGTSATILVSTIFFWLIERSGVFNTLNMPLTFLHTFFCSISARSAGLLFFPTHVFHPATILFILIIAFIGSSPASTGSGMKITTIAVCFATAKAAITGRSSVELFERSIEPHQVYKSIAIVALALLWILGSLFCLFITESSIVTQSNGIFALIVEAISSFTTVGISLGITEKLSHIGKSIILINMIAGRIGSLTLVLGLKLRSQQGDTSFSYPKEQVMLS